MDCWANTGAKSYLVEADKCPGVARPSRSPKPKDLVSPSVVGFVAFTIKHGFKVTHKEQGKFEGPTRAKPSACSNMRQTSDVCIGGQESIRRVARTKKPTQDRLDRLLYRFSGVVHRLSRSFQILSATQTVNNAVAMNFLLNRFLHRISPRKYSGFGSGTNRTPARWTSRAQHFDRSRNPNADTHTQVLTPNVPHYTACAPRSIQHKV